MILKGSQRGGARALARHLSNTVENDHVTLHQVQGLASESLMDALCEIDASKGTSRSNKPFYHLSFNPPEEGKPGIADFESAIEAAENRLGLDNQPRAVVFHEKKGRRHAHVVWSRVDENGRMKKISFDKRRLQVLSRELYQQHGWHMPIGLESGGKAQATNYSLDEWMKSQRSGVSPAENKRLIGEAYRQSDGAQAFAQALESKGYVLALGRRGYVAVDMDGETHSVPRAVGKKKKEVEAWLGSPPALPSVGDAQKQVQARRTDAMEKASQDIRSSHKKELQPYLTQLHALRQRQRADRDLQRGWHQQRREQLESVLSSRYRKGLGGLVDRLTGRFTRTTEQNRREREEAQTQDQAEQDAMIQEQIKDRRQLQAGMKRLSVRHQKELGIFRRGMVKLDDDQVRQKPIRQDHRGRGHLPGFSL